MTFWTTINVLFSAFVALLLVYKLVYLARDCMFLERLGMTFIASGMVMNIGPIIANSGFPFGSGLETPFDDWASTLLRVGLVLYFSARISRHAHRQELQILANDKHFKNRLP